MEHDISVALCVLAQLYTVKLQKLEDNLRQLTYLCELENNSLKYNESAVQLIQLKLGALVRDSSHGSEVRHDSDNEGNLAASSSKRESRRNVYIPKYEWTEERTQRLLDSLERHYSELMHCKDFTKPIWEMIKLEVDPENNNLKWHTCRQKWSHLESDYRNYVKDLKKYMETNTLEMNVFIPQFYEQIGVILRSINNQVIKDDAMDVFQQFVEDRIAEELQTRDSNEEKIKNEPVIIIEH